MDDLDFYRDLGCFKTFSEFPTGHHFTPVPASWNIIVTDISGSTDAIERGLYKYVNLIGAASVSVAHKALQADFPYIFGGDGATLLIPESYTERVLTALCGLRNLARDQFDLTLRVGCVPVRDLGELGGTLEIAKYRLGAAKSLAIFRGDGLNLAEDYIKAYPEKYGVDRPLERYTLLEGLTCNWRLVRNTRGCTLAVILRARNDGDAAYAAFFKAIQTIFRGTPEHANPVTLERMQLKSLGGMIGEAAKATPQLFSGHFWNRLLGVLAMFASKFVPIKGLGTHRRGRLGNYLASIQTHTDYQKFDGTLRMLMDCSEEQAAAIEQYLETAYEAGDIFYGVQKSDNALMTCYVSRLDPGEHVHFVDGDCGGYAIAAKQLKQQIKAHSDQ